MHLQKEKKKKKKVSAGACAAITGVVRCAYDVVLMRTPVWVCLSA